MALTSKILRLSAQKLDHPQRRALVDDQQLVRVMRADGQNRLRFRAPRREKAAEAAAFQTVCRPGLCPSERF